MIPVFSRKFDNKDIYHVKKTLELNWVSSNGNYSKKLIEGIKKKFNTRYVSLVSSGTSALECALKACNIKKGDEIILPAFTIISCLNVILKFGAKPVILDVDINTWLIKEEEIIKNITKKTKAIMIVHIFGNCFNVSKLKKKLPSRISIIEDCAESIGAKVGKKYVGTFGDVATFSFYSNKTITAGEGGMLWTNSKKKFEIIENYKNLFFGKRERFDHNDIGFNYRMTDLQSALAFSQFKKFEINLKKINKVAKTYKKYLNLDNIKFQQNNKCKSVWWMIAFLIKSKAKSKKLMNYLKKHKIDTRNLFKPINEMKFYKKGEKKINSRYLYDYGLYIPSGYDLTEKKIKYISKKINYFFDRNAKKDSK